MPFLSGLSLQRKAALFIAAILVLTIGVSTAVIILTVTGPLRQSLFTTSTLVGQTVIKDLKQVVDLGMPIEGLDGIVPLLDDLTQRFPDVGYIYVTDAKGRLLHRSALVPEGLGAEVTALNHPSAPGVQTSRVEVSLAGDTFYDSAMAVESSGELVGAVHLGMRKSAITSRVNAVVVRGLIVGVASFLVATLAITLFVSRQLSRPLEGLAQTARRISGGELVPPPPTERRDEIGQLSEAFRLMVDRLATIIRHSRETSQGVQLSAADLARLARELSQSYQRQVNSLQSVVGSTGEMDNLSATLAGQSKDLSSAAVEASSSTIESSTAIGEINHHMAEIAESVENIASAIVEMSSTVREVAAGAESTASMAGETRRAIARINEEIQNVGRLAEQSKELAGSLRSDAAETGSRSVRETLQGIRSIQEDVHVAEEAMQALQARVGDIGEIIGFIGDIADQTNLLALNASIISAQAGEHGRAFAVVAGEIRELSVRTGDSTRKIAGLIQAVQGEAANYSASLGRVTTSVGRGIGLGQEAERALEKIIAAAGESSGMAGLIAQATREQAEASRKVSDSVEVFTRSADEIKTATREEAKGAEFIRDAMERTKQLVEMVYKATAELLTGSRLMATTSEKAKEVAGDLAGATETQRTLSASISGAVDSLREATEENSRVVASLNTSSETMSELSQSLRAELSVFRLEEETGKPAGTSP